MLVIATVLIPLEYVNIDFFWGGACQNIVSEVREIAEKGGGMVQGSLFRS